MKKLTLLLLSFTLSFASSLQNLANTFSLVKKVALLQESSSSSQLYTSSSYELKKGWNSLTTPLHGVNVVKTFNDTSKIKYIVTYYKIGKLWAIYAPEETFSNMLFLKYLEPNVTFFVLAKEDVKVSIKSNIVNATCRRFIDNTQEYSTVLDSGVFKDYTTSKDSKMALQSRYFSHHQRGVYNDTRILLIYPNYKSTTKREFKYGPASPKATIKFPKVYEGKMLYIYDFKQEKCFEGVFPSMKIPPFPTLKELK